MSYDLYLCLPANNPYDLELCLRMLVGGRSFDRSTGVVVPSVVDDAQRSILFARVSEVDMPDVTDWMQRHTNVSRNPSEDIDFLISPERVSLINRSALDGVTVVDAQPERFAQYPRTDMEAVDITDDVERRTAWNRDGFEEEAHGVAPERSASQFRGGVEELQSFEEVAQRLLTRGRDALLVVTPVTDVPERQLDYQRATDEDIELDLNIVRGTSLSRSGDMDIDLNAEAVRAVEASRFAQERLSELGISTDRRVSLERDGYSVFPVLTGDAARVAAVSRQGLEELGITGKVTLAHWVPGEANVPRVFIMVTEVSKGAVVVTSETEAL